MEREKSNAMRLTALLLLAIPAQLILSFLLNLIPSGSISANLRNYIIPQILYPLLFEVSYLIIAKKIVPDFSPLPPARVSPKKTVSAAFSFMFAAILISAVYAKFLDFIKIVKPIKSAAFSTDNVFEAVLWIIAMAVLPPVLEEAVFRGAILGTMRKYIGRGSILFSAVLFALMHANFNQIPIAFVMGLLLGWFAYSTGSIIVPIILHAFNNLLSVGYGLLGGFLSEETLSKVDFSVTALIFVLGLIFAIFEIIDFSKKIKKEPKAEKGALKAVFINPSFFLYTAATLGLAVLTNLI